MKSRIPYLIATLLLITVTTQARQLTMSPGDDAKQMIESLRAGDTLWVSAGTYNISDMINVRHGGTPNHRICVFATGGQAVFDFSGQPHTGDDNAKQYRGVLMNPAADYWYWRDIDFTHAADNGMKLEASYCVIERCNFYRNGDTGLQLGFDKDGDGNNIRNPKFLYCRYNQIINCDSYYNYDVQDHGGNADGFANKLYPGPGNEWHGDRCWGNSDDGWDLYYAAYPCLIENCWAIWNGYLEDGSIGVNGNGFKQGGNKQGGGSYGAHIFLNDVAAYNLYHGFDQNNHNEGNWIINCTAFANKQVNFRFNCDVEMLGNTVFHLRNCLGFRPGEANHRFGDMWPDSEFTNWQDILGVSPQYNMGKGIDPKTGKDYIRISAKDWPDYDDEFVDISMETAIGPRQPNGELPLGFARPKPGSIFVDKGTPIENFYCADVFQQTYKLAGKWLDDYSTYVTLPYDGSAPDYGAYEATMERPAYDLQTLPVNDGTLFEAFPVVSGSPAEVITIDGNDYVAVPLIDDELFQDNTLAPTTAQYITEQATANELLPNYYGKSGTWPSKLGKLYGGGTHGALKLAKSSGYIELTLPSLCIMRSMLYGGGKSSTIKVQWKRPNDSNWTDGETFTIDQRIHTIDFTYYGLPQTTEPIIVRLNSTGSNEIYLTDLNVIGCEPEGTPTSNLSVLNGSPAEKMAITTQGIIIYGDVAQIEVFDLAGRKVASSSLSQFCNLAQVPQGMYVVRATMKDGTLTQTKIRRRAL